LADLFKVAEDSDEATFLAAGENFVKALPQTAPLQPWKLGDVEALSVPAMGNDTLSAGLRKLLAVLFDVPETSDEEGFLAGGQKFLKYLSRLDARERQALGLGDLEAFSASFLPMSPADRAIATQLGLSPEEWNQSEHARLKSLAAEGTMSKEELDAAKALGITPLAWYDGEQKESAFCTAEAAMTPAERSVAKQVGMSPLDWKRSEQERLTALSAEAALTPAELAVCRMLNIKPADFAKDK